MPPIENRPFDTLQVGEEERLVHVLTNEDFSQLAAQAATFGAGLVDPAVVASPTYSVDAAQSGWASAPLCALIAGRLPGAGSKLIRQSIEILRRRRARRHNDSRGQGDGEIGQWAGDDRSTGDELARRVGDGRLSRHRRAEKDDRR